MYLPTTHLGFGVLGAFIASIVLWTPFSSEAMVWGMLFGFLPDLDYGYYVFRHGLRPVKYSHEHRLAITHSFFPHLVVSIILFFVWGRLWGCIYFISILSHLFLDSVHQPWGIRWLWPFSSRYYSFGFRSGLTFVTQKELDAYTETRGDLLWIRRFMRWQNPYFLFEIISSFAFIIYLIFFIF